MPLVVPYERDPEFHQEIQHPIADALRKETGLDNLILYHHTCHDSFVVALTDEDRNVDIEILPQEDGKPVCDRETFQRIVVRLKSLVERAEVVKQIKRHFMNDLHEAEDRNQRYYEAIREVHHDLNRKYGPLKAAEWARCTSEHACNPKMDKQLAGI